MTKELAGTASPAGRVLGKKLKRNDMLLRSSFLGWSYQLHSYPFDLPSLLLTHRREACEAQMPNKNSTDLDTCCCLCSDRASCQHLTHNVLFIFSCILSARMFQSCGLKAKSFTVSSPRKISKIAGSSCN